MKINHSLAVAFMATAFIACSQNEWPESLSDIRKPYSGQMEEVNSRVTLDDSHMIHWEMGDRLSIFPGCDLNNLYQVVQITDERGIFEFVSGGNQEYNDLDAHYAVYPYHSGTSVSNKVITTQLPAETVYSGKENSVRHALMTAKSDNTSFTFTNAMGILRLKLNAKQPFMIGKVQKIQLMSKTKGLCGTVTIDYSDDQQVPSAVIEATEDNKTLTLNLVESLRNDLVNDRDGNYTEFYIPMAPETYEANDLLLVITGSRNVYSKYIGCEVDIERKKIFTLAHTISAQSYEGGIENPN